MEKQRIFVDMDGTLYEWRKDVPYEAIFEQYYYLTLKPQKNIVKAVKELVKDDRYDVYILSAVLSNEENPYALAEKNQRLDIDLPEIDKAHRIFCPCGVPKDRYIPDGIRPNDILLDDYSHNLHEWGGIGIKVINDVNARHGTWFGERIDINTQPNLLVRQIEQAVTKEREPHTQEHVVMIPSDRSEPTVYFNGTEEEIEEADKIEAERVAMWKSILDTPGFTALEFDHGNDYLILSPYTKGNEAVWQLSWFWHSDDLATMDRTYGGTNGHDLSALPYDLYKETRTTGARVFVVTTEPSKEQVQRETQEEIER